MGDRQFLGRLETIFWDVDIASLSWDENRDFIIRRVLTHGNLDMLRWLRCQIGDSGLADWLVLHQGSGLSPRQLRYWQVILGIHKNIVDPWVDRSKNSLWYQRVK